MVLYYMANDIIPRWPTSNIPVINPKSGDIAVHLAGCFSFLALGLFRFNRNETRTLSEMKTWVLWSLLLVSSVTILSDRAAILTVISTCLLIFFMRPSFQWAKPLVLFFMLTVALHAFDFHFSFRSDRSISTQAMIVSKRTGFGKNVWFFITKVIVRNST